MMKSLQFLLLAAISGVSQAAARAFEPVATDGQLVEFHNGVAFLIHKNERIHYGIQFVPESSKAGWLAVVIQNFGELPINVSERSFLVTSSSQQVKVYTYAELVKKERTRQAWIAFANGLAAGANSYSASMAGNSNTHGSYSGRTNATVTGYGGTVYGSSTTYGTYSSNTYNGAAAYAAQADASRRNQEMFDRSAQIAMQSSQILEQRALKANTISQNEVVSGQIRMDLPKKNRKQPPEFTVNLMFGFESIPVTFREVN